MSERPAAGGNGNGDAGGDAQPPGGHVHGPGCGHTHAHPVLVDLVEAPHGAVCAHGSLTEHRPRTDAICLDNVSYAYRGGRRGDGGNGPPRLALKNVTLHIEQGCSLGIIGPNGAGKSTLIKIILGLIEGYTGSVSIFGMSPREACRRGDIIGYVPQRHEAEWKFPLSARQVVRMGLVGKTGLFRRYSRQDLAYADWIMERVSVTDYRDKPIGDLSGGQQQRVFIARALVSKPKILVLDEPLVGIDERGQRAFATLMHELHESLGLTVVMVSHDLQAVAAGCNRVACLKQTIHYHDSPQGLTREVLDEVFQHDIVPAAGRPGAA